MKKGLVILTTHFGTNFSGGSTATCEIFSRLKGQFSQVTVVGTKLGKHNFDNLKFIEYKNWFDAVRTLKKCDKSSNVFYGDFYNSFLFVIAGLSFYFTYHDNWPEMGKTSFKNGVLSLFYTSVYKLVFKHALAVFTVSEYKTKYVGKYSNNTQLVRNGFNHIVTDLNDTDENKKGILMVGSVDERKYKLAVKLFEELEEFDEHIDIYGHVHDRKLEEKLKQFPFVTLKGFHNQVPYSRYKLLLHTSMMENLPIVFCEAISNNVPVLAFDVGGSKEIICQGNGSFLPAYDIKKMKRNLFEMIAAPTSELNKKVLDNYSWTKASSKYLNSMNS